DRDHDVIMRRVGRTVRAERRDSSGRVVPSHGPSPGHRPASARRPTVGRLEEVPDMTTTEDRGADLQLKAKHRAMWASGDYAAVAAELIPDLGPTLVAACGITAGQRVLDVAAGTGNAAIPAAAAGADVV